MIPSTAISSNLCFLSLEQFALTEAAYVIVRMLQAFDSIDARDDLPWTEFYTLALFSRHGVKVSAVRSVSARVDGGIR